MIIDRGGHQEDQSLVGTVDPEKDHCVAIVNIGTEYNKVISQILPKGATNDNITLASYRACRFESKVVNEWNMTPERRLELLLENNPQITSEQYEEVKKNAKETKEFMRKTKEGISYLNTKGKHSILLLFGDQYEKNKYAEFEVEVKQTVGVPI